MVDAVERLLSSSTSGLGPKYRAYRLALQGPRSWIAAPADTAVPMAPGI